jgi:hypothetical protein
LSSHVSSPSTIESCAIAFLAFAMIPSSRVFHPHTQALSSVLIHRYSPSQPATASRHSPHKVRSSMDQLGTSVQISSA